MTYIEDDKEATFVAMPFKVNGALFLDFAPFDSGIEETNKLLGQHLVRTHSVAKATISTNGALKIVWLSESKIAELQKQSKIRLQYEEIGVDNTLLITATSEELYKFLEKYEASDIKDKWETSDKFELKRATKKERIKVQ